jgi:hypothetical protein
VNQITESFYAAVLDGVVNVAIVILVLLALCGLTTWLARR